MNSKNSKNYDIKKIIVEYFKSITIAILIAIVIRSFVFESTKVDGKSMMPTLNHGDRLIVSKIAYTLNLKDFDRGDIIVFRAPDRKVLYVKRIIGIAGDEVKIKDGDVYINETKIEETYIESHTHINPNSENKTIKIKNGEFFVLGDNRKLGESKDSRIFGNIERSSIKGKVMLRYFPFKNTEIF